MTAQGKLHAFFWFQSLIILIAQIDGIRQVGRATIDDASITHSCAHHFPCGHTRMRSVWLLHAAVEFDAKGGNVAKRILRSSR
jgi:hypothetical protein